MSDFQKEVNVFKKLCRKFAKEKMTETIADNLIRFLWDLRDVPLEKEIDYIKGERVGLHSNLVRGVIRKTEKDYQDFLKSPYRDIDLDVTCKLYFFPRNNDILIYVSSESTDYKELLAKNKSMLEYNFWDYGERIEGVSEKEWAERKVAWHDVLGGCYGIDEAGFSACIVQRFPEGITATDVIEKVKEKNNTVKRLAQDKAYQESKRGKESEGDNLYFSASEYLDFVKVERNKEYIEEMETKFTSLLDNILSEENRELTVEEVKNRFFPKKHEEKSAIEIANWVIQLANKEGFRVNKARNRVNKNRLQLILAYAKFLKLSKYNETMPSISVTRTTDGMKIEEIDNTFVSYGIRPISKPVQIVNEKYENNKLVNIEIKDINNYLYDEKDKECLKMAMEVMEEMMPLTVIHDLERRYKQAVDRECPYVLSNEELMCYFSSFEDVVKNGRNNQ